MGHFRSNLIKETMAIFRYYGIKISTFSHNKAVNTFLVSNLRALFQHAAVIINPV